MAVKTQHPASRARDLEKKYADIDSTFEVSWKSVNYAKLNPKMAEAANARALRWARDGYKINIVCDVPQSDGRTEWAMAVYDGNRPVIHIGILQRTPDGEVEFHS